MLSVLYMWLNPVSTLMLWRWGTLQSVERVFVPLESVSPHLIEAVLASEDAAFCSHSGIDWGALLNVIEGAQEQGATRGASTLTMQVSKNLFLWHGRSYVRKAIEMPLSLMIDGLWTKRRILEVYVNIAEWGSGVFGIEAASQKYFGVSARDISPRQARLLATALPAPRLRSPATPSFSHALKTRLLSKRLKREMIDLSCVR